MAWMIVSHDSERGPQIRADRRVMDAHWQYELSHRHLIVTSGSLREDDGVTKIGSLLVLDVSTRAEAEAIFANDPATLAGLRGETQLRWLNVAILDRREQP